MMSSRDSRPPADCPDDERSIEEINTMKPPRLKPAWEHLSLEELAKQQGVEPARNLEEVAALWPVDDDPDELLRFILDERKARRDHHTR
jgi:hypothetical protein